LLYRQSSRCGQDGELSVLPSVSDDSFDFDATAEMLLDNPRRTASRKVLITRTKRVLYVPIAPRQAYRRESVREKSTGRRTST